MSCFFQGRGKERGREEKERREKVGGQGGRGEVRR